LTNQQLASVPARSANFSRPFSSWWENRVAEAEALCQEIIVLRHGRLVAKVAPPYNSREILSFMFGAGHTGDKPGRMPSRPADDLLVQMEDVQVADGSYALSDLSLRIRKGEIIGLAGLEGSGQELFLRGLAGLARVAKGRLTFNGEDLQGRPYLRFRRAGVHFLPAARLEQGLFPELSLRDHFSLALPGQSGSEEELCQEGIKKFSIRARPSTCARALSGGNQQRLLLALIPENASLLLMEHPTRGLDVESGQQVWQHLMARCRRNAAVVFSSADFEELKAYSHRILVFYNRRMVADQPSQSLDMETIGRMMAGHPGAV